MDGSKPAIGATGRKVRPARSGPGLGPVGHPGRRAGLPVRAEGASTDAGPEGAASGGRAWGDGSVVPADPADAAAALALGRRVVDLAADKKAADIVLIAISAVTTVADYLVICSGGSERQLGAIADGIVGGLRDEGVRPIGREGAPGAHWVLLDFGAVVVHIFAPPERDYYQLERLWSDAPTILRVQ